MSERYDVRVRIGGRLKRMNLGPLQEVLSEHGLATDWDREPDVIERDLALESASADGRVVEFMTHESDGELTGLKTILENLLLAYQVEISGNDQYAPTTTVWWPFHPRRRGYFLTSDNQPVITLEALTETDDMTAVEELIQQTVELAAVLPGLQLVD